MILIWLPTGLQYNKSERWHGARPPPRPHSARPSNKARIRADGWVTSQGVHGHGRSAWRHPHERFTLSKLRHPEDDGGQQT